MGEMDLGSMDYGHNLLTVLMRYTISLHSINKTEERISGSRKSEITQLLKN